MVKVANRLIGIYIFLEFSMKMCVCGVCVCVCGVCVFVCVWSFFNVDN